MTGTVHGRAGGSVSKGGAWAANDNALKAGAEGERRTAEVLQALAVNGAAVFHDLRIPIPGIKANIDHVVVSGRDVLIIDSKLWGPGFYWTFGGKTRRGLKPFPAADKQTMVMISDGLRHYLASTPARVLAPIVAVWPSQPDGRQSFALASAPGAEIVRSSHIIPYAMSELRRLSAPMPIIEARIKNLVIR